MRHLLFSSVNFRLHRFDIYRKAERCILFLKTLAYRYNCIHSQALKAIDSEMEERSGNVMH